MEGGGELQVEEDLCGMQNSSNVLLCGFVLLNGRDADEC